MESNSAPNKTSAPEPITHTLSDPPAAPKTEPEQLQKPPKKRRIRIWMILLALVLVFVGLFITASWDSIQNRLMAYGIMLEKDVYTSSDGWLYSAYSWENGITLKGLRASSPYAGESRLVLPSEIDGQPVTVIDLAFSQRLAHPSLVKQLVVPSSVIVVDYHAFRSLNKLETFEGGGQIASIGFAGTFNENCPFYTENIQKRAFILGDGVLVHAMYNELSAPDAAVLSGTITVPDEVKTLGLYALDSPNGVSNHSCIVTNIDLPDGILLTFYSLDFFNGKDLTIPDGAVLEDAILGSEWPDQLTDIWVGTNVKTEDPHLGTLTNTADSFQGTLHLADGATLDSLVDFISYHSQSVYTLDCQRGAIPEDEIPSTVKVVYRD